MLYLQVYMHFIQTNKVLFRPSSPSLLCQIFHSFLDIQPCVLYLIKAVGNGLIHTKHRYNGPQKYLKCLAFFVQISQKSCNIYSFSYQILQNDHNFCYCSIFRYVQALLIVHTRCSESLAGRQRYSHAASDDHPLLIGPLHRLTETAGQYQSNLLHLRLVHSLAETAGQYQSNWSTVIQTVTFSGAHYMYTNTRSCPPGFSEVTNPLKS